VFLNQTTGARSGIPAQKRRRNDETGDHPFFSTNGVWSRLNHHGYHNTAPRPYLFAGLCQSIFQGYANCLSSSTSIGFLLVGFDTEDGLLKFFSESSKAAWV
jgi:hypothetical protein